jgi:hypothetical protein
MVHLYHKWVKARKVQDYHIKIYSYKMWQGTVVNLLLGYVLTYALLDGVVDQPIWTLRGGALLFGYAGNEVFNQFIRNGRKSVLEAKDKYSLT